MSCSSQLTCPLAKTDDVDSVYVSYDVAPTASRWTELCISVAFIVIVVSIGNTALQMLLTNFRANYFQRGRVAAKFVSRLPSNPRR